jgi:predicted ATPase
MSVFLHALKLKNYRGIGPTAQKIGPFSSCNFFIGTNNSGKSCVLNFISAHLGSLGKPGNGQSSHLSLQPFEVHLGATASQVEIGLGVPLSVFESDLLELSKKRDGAIFIPIPDIIRKLSEKISESGMVWLEINALSLSEPKIRNGKIEELRRLIPDNEWRILWETLTGNYNGDILVHWVPQVISKILPLLQIQYPIAKIIPAKRRIGSKGGAFGDFSGTGLIDRLAELQNPGPTERMLRTDFEKINKFLQDVTGDESAMIEIPHDRHEVLVHKDTRVLPLSSLGTGIHEVVMIAAFCTLTRSSIVCIEEPEIHLHPLLQKKLVGYITKNTDNQYFIATHSASIVDQVGAAVFHVTQENGCAKIDLITSPSQRFRVCQDLGYRASDLMQTNAIVWVEGPSDRIYINHWIKSIDATLQEGIHYSIMFYGGRLLSHLDANDDEVSEFISLRRLNRNMAIVIDSDKKSSRDRINDTKRRVADEFLDHSDIAWITAGREIENYIPTTQLESVLAQTYTSFGTVVSADKFAHRLHFFQKGPGSKIKTDIDKVKIARTVCQLPADLGEFDLKLKLSQIVSMIRSANV